MALKKRYFRKKRELKKIAQSLLLSLLSITPCLSQSLNDSLLLHLPFSGNATDSSGNNVTTQVFGASLAKDRDGNIDKAYYFDGNDYIETNLTSNHVNLSISVWFKPESIATEHSIVDSDIYNQFGQSLIIGYLGRSKNLSIQYHNGHSNTDYDYPVQVGQWYHAVATFDSTEVKLFVNGQFEGSKTHKFKGLDGSNFRIGKHNSREPRWFQGWIDDVRIYNRVLDSNEVSTLYNGTSTSITKENRSTSANLMSVFPNPSSGDFTISTFDAPETSTMHVFNNLGQIVNTFSLSGNVNVLSTGLSKGVYLFQLVDEDGQPLGLQKVVIQ